MKTKYVIEIIKDLGKIDIHIRENDETLYVWSITDHIHPMIHRNGVLIAQVYRDIKEPFLTALEKAAEEATSIIFKTIEEVKQWLKEVKT